MDIMLIAMLCLCLKETNKIKKVKPMHINVLCMAIAVEMNTT